MLRRLLVTTLLQNTVYLGYHKKVTHPSMFLSLLGTRKGIDLHNLNQTVVHLNKILYLFSFVWQRHGYIWLIIGKNRAVKNFLSARLIRTVDPFVHFWCRNWVSGLFTNAVAFIAVSHILIRFPSFIFYMSSLMNASHFREASQAGILQAGLADSLTNNKYYNYFINANEKNQRSVLYFMEVFALHALRRSFFYKQRFLFSRRR